jgi:hypothetical protein
VIALAFWIAAAAVVFGWWWSSSQDADAPLRTHNNRDELRLWIREHMPELDAELGPLTMDQARVRLNEVTGCSVRGGDSIEDGSAVFLAALQAQHAAEETPP